MAYDLKEGLRQLWDQPDQHTARHVLTDWIAHAAASGVCMLQSLARRLKQHPYGPLAGQGHPISTGPEGINNNIHTLQKRTCAFREREYFMWRIYGLHETGYALPG